MPCNASATRRAWAGSPEAVAVAVAVAHQSDAVVLFLGEESILSGEAHWRADISLPGARPTLVGKMHETGRPVVAFIMAGRPLALSGVLDDVDTMLFAWCPGTMRGAALAGPLFGLESPSGKLPVTFPRMVGQIPTYYSQKNTGKPPTSQSICTFAT
jgi:beta-glucosidase